jgi:hypothetical protein
VGREPAGHQDERCPPLVPEQDRPGRQAAADLDQAVGHERHADPDRGSGDPQVELTGQGEVVREARLLQVLYPGRLGRGAQQPLVQISSDMGAEVCADGVVNRAEHEDEDRHGDQRERPAGPLTRADGADQGAGADGQRGWQHRPGQRGRIQSVAPGDQDANRPDARTRGRAGSSHERRPRCRAGTGTPLAPRVAAVRSQAWPS